MNLNYPDYVYNTKNNLETKKGNFREKASKFAIDKFGYLCFKLPNEDSDSEDIYNEEEEKHEKQTSIQNNINRKDYKKIRREKFKKGEFSLYRIPYRQDEYQLIRKIHEENNHRNWEDTRKEFKKQKYYYRGSINDIKYILSNCPVCAQINIKFYKRESCKTIIFDNPKDRYVLDLTDLPYYIDTDDINKYLLNIIDHFSQLCKSYL